VKQSLAGIAVLVTRPQPAAMQMGQRVRQLGGTAICLPGVELVAASDTEPSLAYLDQLTADDIVIFTSANAVQFALQRKPAAQWPHGIPWVALGQRTAAALASAGMKNVVVPVDGADSESVLQLPLLRAVAGRRVLIACAPGGRQLLQSELLTRGAEVLPVFLYQRKPPVPDAGVLGEIRRLIDQLVITASSVAILENITVLLGPGGRQRPLCVISKRIEQRARELGYSQVHLAKGPDDQALLAAVIAIGTA